MGVGGSLSCNSLKAALIATSTVIFLSFFFPPGHLGFRFKKENERIMRHVHTVE